MKKKRTLKVIWKYLLLIGLIIFLGIFLPCNTFYISNHPVHAQINQNFYFPFFSNYEQPPASTSTYMITVEENFLFNLGCELGTRDHLIPGTQDSVSVLDFSFPICEKDAVFGADLFGSEPVSLREIETAVENFAMGYFNCTGTDNTSNLVIGVGTNNKPISCNSKEKAHSHGIAWAEMVNHINQWILDEGIFHQVQAYGASDIEVGWNTPEWSRAWVDGYDQVNQYPLLHFGDAAGCPYSDSSTSTLCGAGWEMEDVWYVSWGSPPSLPLPLIYRTDGIQAKQWAHLSRYSVSQHGTKMAFTGIFTQSQACLQGTCDGTDNEPFEAFQQLTSELNKFPSTALEINWKTDIRWIQFNELSTLAISNVVDESETPQNSYQIFIDILPSLGSHSTLSMLMQNSLDEKFLIFNSISINADKSRLNPAEKITPSSDYDEHSE